MKILLVEDNHNRIELFKQWIPVNLDVAENATDAIELLKKQNYDLFLLDHDLGDRVYVDSSDENTGYRVAKYIVENDISGIVIVHSCNVVGARNIKNILPRSQLNMFGTFIIETEVIDNEITKLIVKPVEIK